MMESMTVAELIEKLKEMPQDLDVLTTEFAQEGVYWRAIEGALVLNLDRGGGDDEGFVALYQ